MKLGLPVSVRLIVPCAMAPEDLRGGPLNKLNFCYSRACAARVSGNIMESTLEIPVRPFGDLVTAILLYFIGK